MFNTIRYINIKYKKESKYLKEELEIYCNSDQFEYDTNIYLSNGDSLKNACIEVIDNYYFDNK